MPLTPVGIESKPISANSNLYLLYCNGSKETHQEAWGRLVVALWTLTEQLRNTWKIDGAWCECIGEFRLGCSLMVISWAPHLSRYKGMLLHRRTVAEWGVYTNTPHTFSHRWSKSTHQMIEAYCEADFWFLIYFLLCGCVQICLPLSQH